MAFLAAVGKALAAKTASNTNTGKSGKGLKGMGKGQTPTSGTLSVSQVKNAVRDGRELLKKRKKTKKKGAPMNAPAGKYSRAV